MSKSNLKKTILSEYNFDLPISGGYGLSPEDAVIINTDDAIHAPNIEWRIMDCVNKSLERAWLISNKEIYKDGKKLIEKVTTDNYFFKDNEPYQAKTIFYFDISSVVFTSVPNYTFFPTLHIHTPSSLAVPLQMGWLNLVEFTDNEKFSLGDGITYAYDCPSIRGTFYIYNKQYPAIDLIKNYNLILDEFEGSANQIPGEEVDSTILNSIESDKFLKRAYHVDGNESFILLTVVNNHFCKLRLTKKDNDFAFDMTKHIIEQFIIYIRLYQNKISLN